MTVTPRPIAQDIGLFLVIALFANLAFAAVTGEMSARALLWGFYLIAFVHIGATLYAGAFDRARTFTWLLLILGWTLVECASFARYVVPTGQFLFWLASSAPWAVSILELLAAAPSLVPLILLAVLVVDVVFAHRRRWHAGSWQGLAILVMAAVMAGIVLAFALPSLPPKPQPVSPLTFDALPSWHLLPFYAILRAMPDKTVSLIVAFAAIALPALWPWMRAESLRVGTMRWIWLLAWLLFVAAFLGLGYLGAQSAEGTAITVAQALTAYYFAFLLIIPPALRRLGASRER